MNKINSLTTFQLRKDLPEFGPGDTLAVQVKVIEGDKERLQTFEGIVIQKKGSGIQETFTVRKISNGIGVERIFLKHSPRIAQIEVLKKGRVRRAKLYYLRGRKGKHARVAEKVEIPATENQATTDTPSAE